MVDKVPCSKCGKLCGATYLLRHEAKCTGGETSTNIETTRNQLLTELATDVNATTTDIKTETVDIKTESVDTNTDATTPEPKPVPTVLMEEGADIIPDPLGLGTILTVGIFVIIIIVVMFFVGRGKK